MLQENSGAQRACRPCSGPLSPINWKDKLVVSNESLVARRHRLSALWDLGPVTLQGAQSMCLFSQLPLHPSDSLPSAKRGSPLPVASQE